MQDIPNTTLLGNTSATHIKGGRLDYACLIGGHGTQGECEVVEDLVSNHIALYFKITLGTRQVTYMKRRIVLKKKRYRGIYTKYG